TTCTPGGSSSMPLTLRLATDVLRAYHVEVAGHLCLVLAGLQVGQNRRPLPAGHAAEESLIGLWQLAGRHHAVPSLRRDAKLGGADFQRYPSRSPRRQREILFACRHLTIQRLIAQARSIAAPSVKPNSASGSISLLSRSLAVGGHGRVLKSATGGLRFRYFSG